MTGIKIELSWDARATDAPVNMAFYHRQPDVGWVLDGSLNDIEHIDLETESLDGLDNLYPENIATV